MKLVAVDRVPKYERSNHKLQKLIEEFANSDAKFCKVEFEDDEYKSFKVAVESMRVAVKRSKRAIKAHERKGELYLSKEI